MSSALPERLLPAGSQPLSHLQQIDSCCDAFEAAWLAGDRPALEDFLDRAPAAVRNQLLRELLAIELEYRRDELGKPMTAQQVIALHPALTDSIAEEFGKLPTIRTPGNGVGAPQPESGVHIRCPHCQYDVELLEDAPLEQITCRSCGSNFALVEGDTNSVSLGASPPKRVGRFELVKLLGMGGFGAVWKARDTDLDRFIALKIPRRGQISSAEAELFFREARAAAQLRHPHIVPVHEVGRDGDTIFIVSDLIDGQPLSEWHKQRQPAFRDVACLLKPVADALAAAHLRGVIHRDLKPSNVMIDQADQPYLMDFGLAKRQTGEVTMTVDGQILGTPAYMSPEQAAGETQWIDRRTDIYSFGAMMFHLLTGELPFRGSLHSQIRQRLENDAPNPRKLNESIPEDLATICLKCLERDQNRRYGSAQELSDELHRYLDGRPIHARPLSRAQQGLRWAKRNPALATIAALIAMLAVAGPTTAILIETQRRALATRWQERAELIRQGAAEANLAAAHLEQLEQERDRLINANPAAAAIQAHWRASLAQDYLHENYAALKKRLQQLPVDSEARAQANVSLARLLVLAGRAGQAAPHYQKAHQSFVARLSKLDEEASTQACRNKLADCCTEWSDVLTELGNKEQASALAQQAFELRDKLTAATSLPTAARVRRFDALGDHIRSQTTRLADSAGEGSAEAIQLLRQVEEARQAITDSWSADLESAIEVANALRGASD